MMTSSNGNIFRVTGLLCGEFPGPGEFPAHWPVTRSFDVFFDLGLNKRLSKRPWGWWFETPTWSLWRQCNVYCGRLAMTKTFPHLVLIIDKMHHQHSNQKFMNISICESDIKSFMIFLWLHLSSTYTLPLYILRAILFSLWINHEYCETFSFLKNIWIHNYAHFFFKMQTMHGNITICSRLQQIRQET